MRAGRGKIGALVVVSNAVRRIVCILFHVC